MLAKTKYKAVSIYLVLYLGFGVSRGLRKHEEKRRPGSLKCIFHIIKNIWDSADCLIALINKTVNSSILCSKHEEELKLHFGC